MNAPVYVLAIMGNAANELECHEAGVAPRTNEGQRGHGWCEASSLREARAAVVELLEALRLYRIELQRPCGAGDYKLAAERLDTAVARVGGAA